MECILFSVIVPVYNVENYLRRCIENILHQSYTNIEIILVDDGSQDCCPNICDEYAQTDNRIKVIHKQNGGLSDARNAGMEIAKGDYILFVDSDDYIETDTCERFINHLKKHRYIEDIVVGEYQIVDSDKKCINNHTLLNEEIIYTYEEYMNKTIPRGEFYCPAWLNLYNRNYIDEHNLKFCKGLLHEDMEWTPKCFLQGAKVGYLKGYFYNYIIRDGSITKAGNYEKHIKDSLWIYSQWKKWFSNINNTELRNNCYGLLAKCFINSCAHYKIPRNQYDKIISKKLLIKYSREKVKAILFVLNNNLYYHVYDIVQNK